MNSAWAHIAIVLLLSVGTINTSAQWYEEWVVPCEHSGSQDLWTIIRYREGLSSWEKPVPDNGTVRWSDSCIEIMCNHLELYFDVKKYIKESANSFKVFREQYDETFDYMEVRKSFGADKSLYTILMGKLDDDGNIQNAVQITCRPMKMSKPMPFRPMVGGMR